MAATLTGATLTEAQRQAQVRLRASFLREFLPLWGLLDIERLDDTTIGWLDIAVNLIARWRQQSAQRAQTYYAAFRQAETADAAEPAPVLTPVHVDPPNIHQIRTSLLVTGPIGYKSRIAKGFTPTQARRVAFTAVAGAASRHVLNGGRRQLVTAANADEMAVGFARVTDGDPCSWCALLASRGPTYKSRATASATTVRSDRGPGERYHDNCGCTVEPAFSKTAPWPARAREFEKLYEESTADVYGKEKLRAFRRAYEGRQ